jgi:flagellar biosynthesis protein FliP
LFGKEFFMSNLAPLVFEHPFATPLLLILTILSFLDNILILFFCYVSCFVVLIECVSIVD